MFLDFRWSQGRGCGCGLGSWGKFMSFGWGGGPFSDSVERQIQGEAAADEWWRGSGVGAPHP